MFKESFKPGHRGKFALAILFYFFLAQGTALAHGASFGFDQHTHDGITCAIALYSETLDDAELATVSLDIIPFAVTHGQPKPRTTSNFTSIQIRSIRAPPFTSHSTFH